jgi:hypothetical protein
MAARAIAGVGGSARPPWLTTDLASWKGQSRPMTSIPPPATRAQPQGAASSRWAAARVAGARSARPAGAMMTPTGLRLVRGAVAQGLSSPKRAKISRGRRGRQPPRPRCARAVGSTPTRPAALGRSRATCTTASSIRRKSRYAGTGRRAEPRRCSRCSNPPCGCCGASAQRSCQALWGSSNSCGTFVN